MRRVMRATIVPALTAADDYRGPPRPGGDSSVAAGSGSGDGRCEKNGRGRAESGDEREQMVAPSAHGARG
jgi:hypothetical protein